MKRRSSAFGVAAMAFALASLPLAGCGGGERPSDRAGRSSRRYSAAVAELQAGRIDAAIRGFEDVVREEPGNGDAHFQLAALLEDAKKDYLGAIVHYRVYQMMRPGSDKAAVAADRMKGCESRYAALAVERAGADNQFAAELEKLRREHAQCAKREARLSEDLDKAKRRVAALERDVEMKMRLIEGATAIADGASAPSAPKKPLRPTDADLLDDEDGDGAGDGGKASARDIKGLRALLDEEDRTAPARPPMGVAEAGTGGKRPIAIPSAEKKEAKKPGRAIPETYTVQEGDTLMQISARFYGTNHKWREIREANKTVISTDGRVKAGQVIRLP